MQRFAVTLLGLVVLSLPVAAENLVSDVATFPQGVGVSFRLSHEPEKGATIVLRYHVAPRAV